MHNGKSVKMSSINAVVYIAVYSKPIESLSLIPPDLVIQANVPNLFTHDLNDPAAEAADSQTAVPAQASQP